MSTTTTTARARLIQATAPTIYNLSMPVSGTEYSQALSNGTKKIMIKMRTTARARFAFASGATALEWITLEPGAVYFEDGLDLTAQTLFLQSEINGQVAEILEWT